MKPDHEGVVKWWSDSKGYGYLEISGRDVFVHYTGIMGDGFKTLNDGQRVRCDLIEGPKGPQAANVWKVSDLALA